MYQLNSLSLSDCSIWKNVDFKFEEGVTSIRGGNRSGKSSLFTALPASLYGVPLPNRGLATLDFNSGEDHINIMAKSNGKNNHYDIQLNDKDQKVETIADGRAVIDRLITIPDSLFYTTVHVSGLNKHPLAESKAAARLEWIQQVLADSQVYDEYAALVARQMTSLKSDSGKAELLRSQIASIKKPAKPEGMSKEQYTAMVAEFEELKPVIADLNDEVEKLKRRDTIGAIVEFDEVKYDKLKAKVATLDDIREKYREQKATASQREKAKKLKTDIIVICTFLGAPVLSPKKLLVMATKNLAKAKIKLNSLQDTLDTFKEQEDVREDLKIDVAITYSSVKKLRATIEDMQDKKRELKRHVKLFEEGKGECPTCGHEIPKPKDARKALNKIDKELENAALQLRKLEAKNTELVDNPSKKVETQETKITNLKNLKEHCEQYLELDLGSGEEVEYDELRHKKLRAQLDGMGEARAEYKLQMRLLDGLPNDLLQLDDVSELLSKKQKKLSKLNSRLLLISDAIGSWEVYRKLLKQYKKQRENFDEALTELGDVDKKNRVLKALKVAFSRDGLLAMRLDKLTTTFVDQLNACAPLIWNEPFKFDLDIGPRRCDVIAHRNGEAGTITSFSGSEQRGWQLVSALALLRILPSNKRFDTIILDELEANMDEDSKRQFIQDYLPELQKVVPKVIIVTPLKRKELDVNTDRAYRVVKKKSRSTLERLS